ncbi:MAG: hypothetical protein FWE45_03405 [Firmicutes bacterium]|nr:hypothetical protein [Bacillota bacterium]
MGKVNISRIAVWFFGICSLVVFIVYIAINPEHYSTEEDILFGLLFGFLFGLFIAVSVYIVRLRRLNNKKTEQVQAENKYICEKERKCNFCNEILGKDDEKCPRCGTRNWSTYTT